jgi:hypothetical protein
MREQYDAELGLQMHPKTIPPSRARRAKEIDPLFGSRLFENCLVLKGLSARSGVIFEPSYFVFTPLPFTLFFGISASDETFVASPKA